ncbi:PKD domain-containing protein, partial [Metallibacterium scheffleri]|uniref:PKD domain-containing protein n=1 Tax=Metallibacterium scheffleri TaxID=993689 RepID=UPI0023F424CC
SSFSRAFYSIGSHTVTLEVTDSNGFRITLTVSFNVIPQPSVSFTSKYTTIDVGITDVFISTASSGTLPYNYTWYVNNIASGYGPSLDYVFSSSGTYSVKLVLTDADQNKVSSIATITVLATPTASFSSSYKIIDVNVPDLFVSAVSGGTSPYNYTWEINGIVVGYGSVLDHTFTSSGTYTTHLSVVDSFGLSSSYVV